MPVRIVVGIGKESFRADAIEAIDRFDMRKNFNMRKPSVSQENNVTIFIRKKISTERNAFFN